MSPKQTCMLTASNGPQLTVKIWLIFMEVNEAIPFLDIALDLLLPIARADVENFAFHISEIWIGRNFGNHIEPGSVQLPIDTVEYLLSLSRVAPQGSADTFQESPTPP